MRVWLMRSRYLLWLLGLAFLAPARAEQPAAPRAVDAQKPRPSYLRVQRDDRKTPIALETATVRFVPADGARGVEVDLVGVVHVGDRDYYQKLNKQLEQYDVVLFELVAPAGAQVPKGGRKNDDSPLALVTQLAKLLLELELQLEQIDYTRKNFVHADLSPQEMARAIKDRGDNGLTLALSIMADLMRQQNLQEMKPRGNARPPDDLDIGALLLDPDRGLKLKRLMAEQFAQLDDPEAGFGKTINQILVKDRNIACLKVFQQHLAKGKKKFAIFYGAAHMPDFEKRLREEFGLQRAKEEWLQAWDMRPGKRMGLEDLLRKLLED